MKNDEWDEQEELYHLIDLFKKSKEADEILYQLDEPIKYKKLILYPVSVKFYTFFHSLAECLLLPKHKVNSIKVIQMKYFDYLFYIDEKLGINNLSYLVNLKELLLLCLKKKSTFKTPNGKEVDTIEYILCGEHWKFRIENEIYDANDFEKIKNIICKQNMIELPDLTIHPDLEKKYEQFKEWERKKNKIKIGSFEDMLLCLVAKTSYSKEELSKLTIRTFTKLLERIEFIMNNEMTTLLSPNLTEQARSSILPWNAEIPKKDKLAEMSTDFDEFQKKVNSAN